MSSVPLTSQTENEEDEVPADLQGDLERKWPYKMSRLYFAASNKPVPHPSSCHPVILLGEASTGQCMKVAELGYLTLQQEAITGKKTTKTMVILSHGHVFGRSTDRTAAEQQREYWKTQKVDLI